ncbi:MAG: hypothetical protein JNK52_11940, partial [Zoogloeaceae bacterium]|nr:hypothetical protein [Zoogloeaceae bacterium]
TPMLELLGASAAMIGILTISYFVGRSRKRDNLARLRAHPQDVARLYLRTDADTGALWLHAQFNNGKKVVIAAPWEAGTTLRTLAEVGLRLSADDQAAFDASAAHGIALQPSTPAAARSVHRQARSPAGASA